jgi:hypothetical protein
MNERKGVAMEKKKVFSVVLAIAGTALVLLPILFMVVTSVAGSIMSGTFRCDYMIPAELGLFVIGGSVALLWAAIRERLFLKPIIWTLVGMVVLIVGCTGIAALSGLASGRVQETEVPGVLFIVYASLIGYDVGVTVLGVFGILLTITIFKSSKKA